MEIFFRVFLRGYWGVIIKLDKLNIGSGDDYKEGFINIDFYNSKADIKLDLNKGLYNIKKDSVKTVYASHVFEHLYNCFNLFHELDYVLKKGGKIVVKLPNQSSSSLGHIFNNITVDFFYSIRDKYDIKVSKGYKLRFRTMILRNYKSFRDWIFRRLFDEYTYVLVKK